jgi:hypothetical protein
VVTVATHGRVGPDGTQAPPPPPTFPDPLAGLVTGVSSGSGIRDYTPDDFVEVEIAEPVEPDPEVVRGMVDAALSREQDVPTGPTRAVARPGAVERAPAAQPPLGMLQQQQRGGAGQSNRVRQALLPRQGRPPSERAESADPVMSRPSSGSAGVALAIILLVVFGILVIQLISSLFSSVSGVFD